MDQGSASPETLAEMLRASGSRAEIKAMIEKKKDAWHLRYIRAVVGPDVTEDNTVWQYESLAFVSTTLEASELAVLPSDMAYRTLVLGPFEVDLPPVRQDANWERKPSFARLDSMRLPWPTKNFTLYSSESQSFQSSGGHLLVGLNCPSFTESNSAFRAFFDGNFALAGASSVPSDFALIRFVANDGWLGNSHVGTSELRVEVCGRALGGVTLELFGVTDRQSVQVEGPSNVRFQLADGLPEYAWLWLKSGTRWLDYRALHSTWTTQTELEDAGVHFDIPEEPSSVIEALVTAGEGPQLEYKSKIPETADERRSTFKTIAAFATGKGGTVVFGVDRDELTVVGLGSEDPKKLRDQLSSMIRSRVIPTPNFEPSVYVVEGKTLLVLRVDPSPSPPYGITVDDSSKERPEFYVRRGASTYPAQPNDMRETTLTRPGHEIPQPGFPRSLFV